MSTFPIGVDVALNLLWAVICLSGLGILGLVEYRRYQRGSSIALSRRAVAVLVLTLALFPAVSASDDELSFWCLTQHAGSRGGVGMPAEEKERSNEALSRLFDVAQTFQIEGFLTLAFALCFFAVTILLRESHRDAYFSLRQGRAPPVFV